MRRHLAALAAAGAGLGLSGGLSVAAASAQPADPPECVKVNIIDASGNGPVLYTIWCGTGSEGISPMRPGVAGHGPLIVNGADLSPAGCTAASRCSIVWPLSPQTGP